MRVARTLLALVAAVVVMLGAAGFVALPPGTVIAALMLGALAGGGVLASVSALNGARAGKWATPSPTTVVWSGVCGAGGGLALAGMVAILGAATFPVVLLLSGLAAPWLWHQMKTGGWLPRGRGPKKSLVDTPVSEESPVVAPESREITALTTAQLCFEWRHSYLALQRASDPRAWQRVVKSRQLYLEELERRDPEGFSRWLREGARAGSDPNRFLANGP
ncbi:hypothetical protein [Amycolatopsis sp. H20-H5]|uniref:hypothetical protein n=1 Tax=Amycolatopsis sp. H20-H5 TaxID=3046309 RepID=UPI002DBEC046|nr:hypothetical protein [Amycolatopsis sp. H20-H5]MEC3980930.1 hypothetical protein [Amycolatopsis sp. H20-H5]